MNTARVFCSLNELQKLAERIGRSWNLGKPPSSGMTQMWERQLTAHVAEIMGELNRHAATKSPSQSSAVLGRN